MGKAMQGPVSEQQHSQGIDQGRRVVQVATTEAGLGKVTGNSGLWPHQKVKFWEINREAMDNGEGEGYKPEAAFQEDTSEQPFDLSLTNSIELWLIQWPFNEVPDFNWKEISLNLHHDGCLGTFEASVGKTYDVVSSAVQEPDATVFVSLSSKTKIVGKISRRVSLVHYLDLEELEKQETEKKSKRRFHMSGGSSLVNSSYHSITPTQSTKLRNSNLSKGATSSHSSRHKSSLSEVRDDSTTLKGRHIHKHNATTDRSTLDAGRGQSIYTISGLSDIHTEEN